jgi:hypothetical protein
LTTAPGRFFVEWYYRISPPLANVIRTGEVTRAGVRVALLPVVGISYLALTIGVVPALLALLFFVMFASFVMRKLYLYRRNIGSRFHPGRPVL